MKSYWLNKTNPQTFKKLIVFFAGWSFDYNPFLSIKADDFDILMLYDYNDLDLPEDINEISKYENKTLIAWSMGVFVAPKFKNILNDFDKKIAINGTQTPVDNDFGIPVKMFELTLRHAEKGLSGKFYQNVFLTEEEYERYSKSEVQRSVSNRVSELENLYNLIKNDKNINTEDFYDMALVSDYDKIIPPKNQIASHKTNNVSTITIPYGHFPYYNFESWNDIIQCKQTLSI